MWTVGVEFSQVLFFFSIYFGLDWFPCRWTRSKCNFYRIPFCSYLAAGMQFRNLAYSFRISEIPVDVVVVQGCKAVWRKIKKLHVPRPRDSYFQRIADSSRGSYDSCVRCVDGEHTRMNCGSTYFCCKTVTLLVCLQSQLRIASSSICVLAHFEQTLTLRPSGRPWRKITNFKITINIHWTLFCLSE